MKKPDIIWLASYPRSGNTLLRTILWHCFGLRSASIYPNDLGGKKNLESYVGHVEHGPKGQIQLPSNGLPLVKTHEYPVDDNPAIYVVRDGRATCVSLWQFYKEKISLDDIIAGRHHFGTWTNHVQAWEPWERPNTLLIKYEDMISDLPAALGKISTFFKFSYPILNNQIPNRETIADVDGRWVRKKNDWKSQIKLYELDQLNKVNEAMLRKMGYLD